MVFFVQKENIAIGKVQKIRGLDGQMVILLAYPAIAFPLKMVSFYQHHTYVPYLVTKWTVDNTHALLQLERVRDRGGANRFHNHTLFAEKEAVGRYLSATAYSLIGYRAIDQVLGELGRVVHVDKESCQSLLHISYKGKTLLLPFHDHFIHATIDKEKTIITQLPAGYLDSFG